LSPPQSANHVAPSTDPYKRFTFDDYSYTSVRNSSQSNIKCDENFAAVLKDKLITVKASLIFNDECEDNDSEYVDMSTIKRSQSCSTHNKAIADQASNLIRKINSDPYSINSQPSYNPVRLNTNYSSVLSLSDRTRNPSHTTYTCNSYDNTSNTRSSLTNYPPSLTYDSITPTSPHTPLYSHTEVKNDAFKYPPEDLYEEINITPIKIQVPVPALTRYSTYTTSNPSPRVGLNKTQGPSNGNFSPGPTVGANTTYNLPNNNISYTKGSVGQRLDKTVVARVDEATNSVNSPICTPPSSSWKACLPKLSCFRKSK